MSDAAVIDTCHKEFNKPENLAALGSATGPVEFVTDKVSDETAQMAESMRRNPALGKLHSRVYEDQGTFKYTAGGESVSIGWICSVFVDTRTGAVTAEAHVGLS